MTTSDVPTVTTVSNILLQENDLPPKDEGYLTLMRASKYVERYGDPPKVVYNGRRLLIVLPLYIVDAYGIDKVIPIPFIADTGAPHTFYLGTGARDKLREMQVLYDVMDVNSRQNYYRLWGIFYNQKKSSDRPVAVDVPEHYEEELKGDVRINILGLKGMRTLKVNLDWDNLD